jgi:hypothetical protein
MNLPLNQNPAGVTELDLRETGGFIPPVGVKEKADDIPAMLSNNEFVFTANVCKRIWVTVTLIKALNVCMI